MLGCTKETSIERDDSDPASNSYVVLNKVLTPDRAEQRIMWCNMPFGTSAHVECGTHLIEYTRSCNG
ncbi:hypothetical protein ACWDWS_31235 [Streptomyces sp. NPDC003328]